MAMTPAQEHAFQSANTGVLSNGSLNWLVLTELILGAIIFLWCAWVMISCYKAWGAGGMSGDAATGVGLRALVIMLIMLVVISV